jgi:hypothetical protein
MTLFAFIALFGWIPFVVILFAIIPVRQAAAAAVVGAWLLLPPIKLWIVGLPDFTKNSAIAIGIVLGTILFGSNFVLRLRPRWFDVPMLLWCCTVIGTSLHNGLGLYDGLASAFARVLFWGVPYLAGRLYFSNLEGLRIFTVAMIVGGLSYVLPCLWEMRAGPHLMKQIYGTTGHGGGWGGVVRVGGYRPNVLLATGLECGMWMCAAALVAWWLHRCGTIKRIGQIRFGPLLVWALVGTAILCRSTGAILLFGGGIFILWASTRLQTRRLLWALVLFLPLYAGLRVPNLWAGDQLVRFLGVVLSPERASSLEYRFMCENLLIRKALEQPVWGWGGFGRNFAYFDKEKTHRVNMDGLWIITLGSQGFVGLSLLYLVLELPVILFLVRFPAQLWSHPQVAPAAVAATLLGLYMIDCTVNGFINIIYICMAGGLIGVTPTGVRLVAHAIHDEQSNQVLSRAVVSRITMTDRYRELGRSLKAQGIWADAYSAWQQALEMLTELLARRPDHPDLVRRWCDCGNDLAWLLLNHPDLDLRGQTYALSLAAQVADRCPASDVYRNTLGAAYLRNGDAAGTIAVLDGAASSEAENPFNYVFLAMAYAQLGDREKARHWLVRATLLRERSYQNHDELAGFCDEVHVALGNAPACTLPLIP